MAFVAYLYIATAMFLSSPLYAVGFLLAVVAVVLAVVYVVDRAAGRRRVARVVVWLPAQRTDSAARPAPPASGRETGTR